MRKITPFLWFDGQAEEAAKFYCSIFKNSKIIDTRRYGNAGPGTKGSVMTVTFRLDGEEFIALNGGPHFQFTPAISLFVRCRTQREVDRLWQKPSQGGKEVQCGWLTDKYGLSWQIVPEILGKLLADKDPAKSERVMQAMLQMVKLDIKALQQAYKNP
jgi:predicted 3-demethylubiquinone-9 3-methyltransferase (glyoxalase superfamily)